MTKYIKSFLLCGLAFLATSCFEIKESIFIKKDGSGSYSMVMDFSASKQMFNMMLQLADSEEGKEAGLGDNPAEGLDSAFIELATELNAITGISNAKGVQDKENFTYGIKMSFENVDALNMALSQMDAGGESVQYKPYYDYTKGNLEKANIFNLKNLTDEIIPENEDDDQSKDVSAQLSTFYETVTYQMIIKTDGKIKRFSNNEAVLSDDKRELTFSKSLKELQNEEINIGNTIKFK
ncbi:hypothetical protein R9C00_28005 [Flammeovirgaceae bacterium SG7u.111]|nr:hypothetical protein [Flammeovirgaceae bacterium SG7u.132]WPO35545.1 hypothetical protein R9C00_28005 [Flammeovirgaceae bacterium SG7u.111]